jgi:hypothetical protein
MGVRLTTSTASGLDGILAFEALNAANAPPPPRSLSLSSVPSSVLELRDADGGHRQHAMRHQGAGQLRTPSWVAFQVLCSVDPQRRPGPMINDGRISS